MRIHEDKNGNRLELTDEEYVAAGFTLPNPNADDAAEAARLAKRPKRSEINALKAKVATDNSVASLRATVDLLIGMMDSVLAFQQVDVDEDA